MLYIPMYRYEASSWEPAVEAPFDTIEEASEWVQNEIESDSCDYEYVIVTGEITHEVVKPTTSVVLKEVTKKAPAKKPATKKPVKKAAKN